MQGYFIVSKTCIYWSILFVEQDAKFMLSFQSGKTLSNYIIINMFLHSQCWYIDKYKIVGIVCIVKGELH